MITQKNQRYLPTRISRYFYKKWSVLYRYCLLNVHYIKIFLWTKSSFQPCIKLTGIDFPSTFLSRNLIYRNSSHLTVTRYQFRYGHVFFGLSDDYISRSPLLFIYFHPYYINVTVFGILHLGFFTYHKFYSLLWSLSHSLNLFCFTCSNSY